MKVRRRAFGQAEHERLGSGERRHFEAGGKEEFASEPARVSAARADECSCGHDVDETNGAEFSALASATKPRHDSRPDERGQAGQADCVRRQCEPARNEAPHADQYHSRRCAVGRVAASEGSPPESLAHEVTVTPSSPRHAARGGQASGPVHSRVLDVRERREPRRSRARIGRDYRTPFSDIVQSHPSARPRHRPCVPATPVPLRAGRCRPDRWPATGA